MKTTIELPDSILRLTKIEAARRRTSLKNLVIEGLEKVLREAESKPDPSDAIARLERGFHLGGQPLSREESHAR